MFPHSLSWCTLLTTATRSSACSSYAAIVPTALSDLFNAPAYSPWLPAASPSPTAYEQHAEASDNINSGSSGVSLDEHLATEIARYEAAVAVSIRETFRYMDQAAALTQVSREYVEGMEAWEMVEVRQQELKAENRYLFNQNLWLLQHQHDVSFNNPVRCWYCIPPSGLD